MILDSMNNRSLYDNLGPLFKKAFDFLSETDLKALPLGKHLIEEEDLFVIIMEYDSKDPADCIMENHRKYTDIQYIVSGEELMGIKTYNGEIPIVPYDENKDAAFYKPEFDSVLKVGEGQFTVFFPHDLHMPSMKAENVSKVRKAVFKVRA